MIDYRENNHWTVYIHIIPKELSGYEWNKYYVGVTGQINVNKRWCNGKGYKHQKYFNNAILKYGWNNIQHEIVADHLTKNEAYDFEKILIQKLQSSDIHYGYNISVGGLGNGLTDINRLNKSKSMIGNKNHMYGRKLSENSKKLISLNHYECSGGNNGMAKPVYQFSLDGIFIQKFPSTKEAHEVTKTNRKGISYAALNNKIANGFLWIYDDNVEYNNGTYRIINFNYKPKKLTKKEVYQFDINGNFIRKYDSCVLASKISGVSKNTISDDARNKYLHHRKGKKDIWRYKEDVKESDILCGSFILL